MGGLYVTHEDLTTSSQSVYIMTANVFGGFIAVSLVPRSESTMLTPMGKRYGRTQAAVYTMAQLS